MISDSRLVTIIENEGYDCTRKERAKMAEEILELRSQRSQWKGNTGGAGHGYDDNGLNPIHSK